MGNAPLKAVLDANVLFPFSLRDTLLRAAAYGLFQLYWSETILDETTRNLVATGRVSQAQARRLRSAMTAHFPEAMVVGYEDLVSTMPNQEKDRHVVAAAVAAGARLIVTNNLKDFRVLPPGVHAQSPDSFLVELFEVDAEGMLEVIQAQARALTKPTRSVQELLRGLAKAVPRFVAAVTELNEAGTRVGAHGAQASQRHRPQPNSKAVCSR